MWPILPSRWPSRISANLLTMVDLVSGILLVGACLLVGVILVTFFRGKQRKSLKVQPVNVSVSLDELSKLWAKARETGEIRIDDLAQIWREEKSPDRVSIHEYSFGNKKIADFFQTHIDKAPWFRRAPQQKEVCYQILLMLEREGNCPSVVNAADDVEASWDSNTYTLLGRTTLLGHTLNVALEVIKLLSKEDAGHVIPDTMIAALGHDLGKIPSIRGHLYSLGEHPLAAGRLLSEISSFKQLTRKEEISRAIKLHHKQPEGLLGQTLKKADQLARQKELEWAVELMAGESIINAGSGDTTETKNKKTVQPEPAVPPAAVERPQETSSSMGSDAAWRAQADIYGEEKPEKSTQQQGLQRINIAAWFDMQKFLDSLKPYINRIDGRRFMAFSMANGYVYFQAKALEEVARQQAEQAGTMDIVTMAADDPNMRRVLLSVVDQLRTEGLIARELIKDQYFGGYFTIITGGRNMKGFYTPFHAEAFGSIAEMEQAKTGILKNFRSVKPFSSKDKG